QQQQQRHYPDPVPPDPRSRSIQHHPHHPTATIHAPIPINNTTPGR
ncbi:unnamed protein product, partial [Adineta steineri]